MCFQVGVSLKAWIFQYKQNATNSGFRFKSDLITKTFMRLNMWALYKITSADKVLINLQKERVKRLNWVLYMEAFSCPDLYTEVALHCL